MVKLADIQAFVKVQLSIISATDFIYRFTNDEQLAIASVPQGLVLWLRLLSFSYIELGNSEVVNSLNSLVTAGILTLPRKIAILTP